MNKVKGYRTMINMTQEEMSAKLGISARAYINKETGNGAFTVDELKKIVSIVNDKGLNLTINDLV